MIGEHVDAISCIHDLMTDTWTDPTLFVVHVRKSSGSVTTDVSDRHIHYFSLGPCM